MIMLESEKIVIRTEDDIIYALHMTRRIIKRGFFSEADEQRILVSVSELTRNVLDHTNTFGILQIHLDKDSIEICVKDYGDGIQDLDAALEGRKSIYSKGLGIGLSGVKRLMDGFEINTSTGGTNVIARKRATRENSRQGVK